MKKIKTCILFVLVGVILSGAPSIARAYQIAPNPNQNGSTITVGITIAENTVVFDNSGVLQINSGGTLNNILAAH